MPIPHPPGHLTDDDFRSEEDKWLFLFRAPEVDCLEPEIHALAVDLWNACASNPRSFVILAQAFCRDVIFYMSDGEQFGGEDIAPAGALSDVLHRLVDDCDAKARLFVALCRAVRLVARMVPHWEPADTKEGRRLAHVSAEAELDGKIVPVEVSLARARLGEEPPAVPKEATGHWLLNTPQK